MDIQEMVKQAVAQYWITRERQKNKQKKKGATDTGSRSAATGGAQMDGFNELLTRIVSSCGVQEKCIFYKSKLQIPGFFRPSKKWDLLVVEDGKLLAAIEAKSQVGPSFGNNFNNRVEESIGSAVDVWTAFREGLFGLDSQPFIGYIFMLEDCEKSKHPVKTNEPHFSVLPEFQDASYQKRYEIFCRKLVLERHYTSVCYLLSESTTGLSGAYSEPLAELSISSFVHSLITHISVNRKRSC